MARRNKPFTARKRYVDALQAALRCITESSLLVIGEPRVNQTGRLVLNQGDPVILNATPQVKFSVGQEFRIINDPTADEGPFRATTVRYSYVFETMKREEILLFHWAPETTNENERTFPHLHVGQGILNPQGIYRPKVFSKLHVPTERVSLEWVVRFAIEELNVMPLVDSWELRLEKGNERFRKHRRQGIAPRPFEG